MKYLLIFIICFVGVGCQKIVEVPIQNDITRLVIEANIERKNTSDSAIQVIRLTQSAQVNNSSDPSVVSDADVVVRGSDNSEHRFFFFAPVGRYVCTTFVARSNVNYTLNIVWRGDTYTATERVIPGARIDSIYQFYQNQTIFQDSGLVVKIDFTDPITERNYYRIDVLRNDTLKIVVDPGNEQIRLREDTQFNGKKVRDVLVDNEVIFKPGDTATVRLSSISQYAYEAFRTMFIQTGGGTIGGNPPPVPIRSNVANTTSQQRYPLGYYSVADVSIVELGLK